MSHCKIFVLLFVIFVAFCVTNVNAIGATRRKLQRLENQQKYDKELIERNYITINDKIYYDKIITTEYMRKICPTIIDLTLKDITEYYLVNGLTKNEYQEIIIKNVSDVYMNEVYVEKHIPTYRSNVNLFIDISDIYTYQKNHCEYYFLNYKNNFEYNENFDKYKQIVHQHNSKHYDLITIEEKPIYNIDHYDFQTVLCPVINELLTNKRRLNSDKLMNNILTMQNITKEYMNKIYTEENFKEMKRNGVKLKVPSLEDIYNYEKNHCHRNSKTTFENILYTIHTGLWFSIISVIIYSIYISSTNLKHQTEKNE
jgi:hypothetical protein